MLGLKIPDYVDGDVISEALKPEFLAARPVRFGHCEICGDTGEASLTDEEQRK